MFTRRLFINFIQHIGGNESPEEVAYTFQSSTIGLIDDIYILTIRWDSRNSTIIEHLILIAFIKNYLT